MMKDGVTLNRKGLICPKCKMTAPEQPIKSAVVSHNCPKAKRMIELVKNTES